MSKRPNVLFLLSDEHSPRFLGCLPANERPEPVETPALDRLAKTGTRFANAYCAMPLCTPSRLCLLAGREVRGAGAWDNGSVLRPELPTWPGAFAKAGYETCLVGKMHLGGSVQYVGFRHRPYGDLTGKAGHQWEPLDADGDRLRGRTADAGVTQIPESLLQETVVNEETIAFLREHVSAKPEQPWFLCASYSRPHFPLTAPKRWIDRYPPSSITPPTPGPTGDAQDHPMTQGMRDGFKVDQITSDEAAKARAAYFACVSYFDQIVGDLLVRLEASGLLDNTIIVYTSDHGELAGEHGLWWKHGWFDNCTRVPLIVSTPESRRAGAGRVLSTPVSLLDLFPTLATMCGVPVPDGLDGADVSRSIREGVEPEDRPIFCDNLVPRWGAGTEFRAIRWKRWKYVTFRNAPPLLFDLVEDPAEQHDLLRSPLSPEASEAKTYLERIAHESIDFHAAERERTVRDDGLRQQYKLANAGKAKNLYHMPSGQLISADETLYRPTVVSADPKTFFHDWPG